MAVLHKYTFLLTLTLFFFSCSSPFSTDKDLPQKKGRISTENIEFTDLDTIETNNDSVEVKITAVKKDKNAYFASDLYINVPNTKRPLALKRNRLNNNKAIYYAQIPQDRYKKLSRNNRKEVSCTIDFSGVGEECGDFGECPEESLLGGPTWFCACIEECEVSF